MHRAAEQLIAAELRAFENYSNSIVPGGLLVRS